MSENQAEKLAQQFLEQLRKANFAVTLTGAGVSTASGIPDFRGPNGIYSKISQRTFEVEFLFSYPEDYYKIAIEHIHPLADKKPNITHIMLAKLEERHLLKAIITQNIDGLHKKAGAKNVIEFHGNVTSFHCIGCNKTFNRASVDDKIRKERIPSCDCGSLIRPDIVFFGDPIPAKAIADARNLAAKADLFITVGSSLTVNPAAQLPLIAKHSGARLLIINKGPTAHDWITDHRYDVSLEDFSAKVLELLKA